MPIDFNKLEERTIKVQDVTQDSLYKDSPICFFVTFKSKKNRQVLSLSWFEAQNLHKKLGIAIKIIKRRN